MKRYMVNRKVYKEIKRYDHQQMEAFISKIYEEAYKDGMTAAEERAQEYKGLEVLLEGIKKGECKGVKEATANKILNYAQEKGLIVITGEVKA